MASTKPSRSSVIELRCPACQKRLRVPAEVAGRRGRCPACRATIRVPAAEPTRRARPKRTTPRPPQAEPRRVEPGTPRGDLLVFFNVEAPDKQGVCRALLAALDREELRVLSWRGGASLAEDLGRVAPQEALEIAAADPARDERIPLATVQEVRQSWLGGLRVRHSGGSSSIDLRKWRPLLEALEDRLDARGSQEPAELSEVAFPPTAVAVVALIVGGIGYWLADALGGQTVNVRLRHAGLIQLVVNGIGTSGFFNGTAVVLGLCGLTALYRVVSPPEVRVLRVAARRSAPASPRHRRRPQSARQIRPVSLHPRA